MPQESNCCTYDYKGLFPERQCMYPVYADGLCIFHLPKIKSDTNCIVIPGTKEYSRRLKIEKDFLDEFSKELIKQYSDPAVKTIEFLGFRFPDIDLNCLKLYELIGAIELHKPVDFSVAEFQLANFSWVVFRSADFSFASFKEANFFESTFHSVEFVFADLNLGDFREAKFHLADFRKTIFRSASFSRATVFDKMCFDGEKHDGSFSGHTDFSKMEFIEKGSLVFSKVNLSKALFRGTPLLEGDETRVVFDDVTWWKKSIFRRKVLQDEYEVKTPQEFLSQYQGIYDLYHQLVKIYEAKREFETAEDFHIGEMEMRRKRIWAAAKPWCRWHRRWTNSYFLYKILSNYGTSYWHALVVLCLMLLGFGVFSLLSGFSVDGYPVEYNLSPHWQITWTDVWSALGYALSALPLKHDAVYKASAPWLEIVKGLASLVLSGQLALTLLAVRRRFKR